MAGHSLSRLPRLAIVVAGAASLSGCGINGIPIAEENVKMHWAELQNQYQRRADLIPNLVATVKAGAANERGTLDDLAEARAKAGQIQVSTADVTDPVKLGEYKAAQEQIGLRLTRLLDVVQSYPDLKSSGNFLALQGELEGTENRIAIARRDYNSAVYGYNTTIRTFPTSIVASVVYAAKPMAPFEASAGAATAPTVDFK